MIWVVSGLLGEKTTNFNTRETVITAIIANMIKKMATILTQRRCHHLCVTLLSVVSSLYTWFWCMLYSTRISNTNKERTAVRHYVIFFSQSFINKKKQEKWYPMLKIKVYSYLCLINVGRDHDNAKQFHNHPFSSASSILILMLVFLFRLFDSGLV